MSADDTAPGPRRGRSEGGDGDNAKHYPVACVEFSPTFDPASVGYRPTWPRMVHPGDGWQMVPYRARWPLTDCVLLLHHEPEGGASWFGGYDDAALAGVHHGTDCELSRWVAAGGLGQNPDCQRMAAGGSFRYRVLGVAA